MHIRSIVRGGILISTLWLTLVPVAAPQAATLASNGMVSSAHPLATDVGVDILKKGGNAFDAAIAVHFALAVVYPHAGNLGGGGFALFRDAAGQSGALDFREKAPMTASRDMYLDAEGHPVKGLSLNGGLAVGVPGSVDGMLRLHGRYAQLPLATLIQPAIDLARKGHPLGRDTAAAIVRMRPTLQARNRFDHLLFSRTWTTGDWLTLPALANTLERIRDRGRDGFYKGETARLLLEEIRASQGIISQQDLDAYEARWRTPVEGDFRGYRVISMPPPSSGGVALLQMLEGWEALAQPGRWPRQSVDSIHLMTELQRRVYADRATWMGDPDFVDVPVRRLLSHDYLDNRFSSIDPTRATDSQAIKAGSVERIESFETTHFSVVDGAGNAVSVTTTLNGYFGTGIMVRGGGFFLNNEMDDFSVKPGVPNQFGLVGAEANAIAPQKRMLSSMTPTLVETPRGGLFMVLGTPGGSTIITSVFQTLVNIIDYNMDLQAAIDAPKTHAQWLPDLITVESSKLPEITLDALKARGHRIRDTPQLGRMNIILVHPDGLLEGAFDPTRSDGKAAGY